MKLVISRKQLEKALNADLPKKIRYTEGRVLEIWKALKKITREEEE